MDLVLAHLNIFGLTYTAGLLMAGVCGFLGTFIVTRQLVFLADTLAHGSLTGIALGYALGVAPESTIIPFSVFLAVFLTWCALHQKHVLTALTAVVYSASIGVGIILLTHFTHQSQEIVHVLFGNLLWIGPLDVWILVCVSVPVLFFLYYFRRVLFLMFLDEGLAHAMGVKTRALEYAFMIAVAVIVAACMKLAGTMLVTAMMAIPALAAARLSQSLRQQLFLSPILAVIAAIIGMAVSAVWDLPTGATIVTVLAAAYVVIARFSKLSKRSL